MVPALVWLLTAQAFGLAILPLTVRAFAGFPDRGYGLGRILGLVVVGWIAYLSAMLGFTAYTGLTVGAIAALLAAVLWIAWGAECVGTLRPRLRLLAIHEAVFLAVFGLATFVRAYNADIIGQEKFMDYAFVHALLRTTVLPAEDMWLSGLPMPYYYLGYLLVGLPAKVAGTPGPMAYSLAMVLVFTTGFCAAFSIVYALVASVGRNPGETTIEDRARNLPDSVPSEAPVTRPTPAQAGAPGSDDPADAPAPDGARAPILSAIGSAPAAESGSTVGVAAVRDEAVQADADTADAQAGDGSPTDRQPNDGSGSEALHQDDGAPDLFHVRMPISWSALAFGLLGGCLTVVVGNLVAVFELISARGWGSPELWQAVGVKGLVAAPSPGLLPAEGGWWWRSSRVIPNIPPDGITEFPYFSFILGDLHPHYVAIPFTLLVVGLAVARWLDRDECDDLWFVLVAGCALATLIPASTWDVPAFWGLYGLTAIAEAWRREPTREGLARRLPRLLAPFVLAAVLVLPYFVGYQSQPLALGIVRDRTPAISFLILFGPALLIVGLFLAWLVVRLTSDSTPGAAEPTAADAAGTSLALPATPSPALPATPSPALPAAPHGLPMSRVGERGAGGEGHPPLVRAVGPGDPSTPPCHPERSEPASGVEGSHSRAVGPGDPSTPLLRRSAQDDMGGEGHPAGGEGSPPRAAVDPAVIGRVLLSLGLLAVGLAAIGEPTLGILVVPLLGLGAVGWPFLRTPKRSGPGMAPAVVATWLLMAWAICILFGVELIYLRDVFGSRMNTVFKFHYQAWVLLGVAGAAGLGLLWRSRAVGGLAGSGRLWPALAAGVGSLVLLPGLVYPLGATWTKSNGFRGEPTLMGDRFLQRGSPSDYQAIEWLRQNAVGRPVVVEAVGGDYTEHARVSTFSGLPTLIGWVGHELQWRGQRPEFSQREQAVDAVYRATTREELLRIGRNLRIRYVFFGTLERQKYGPDTQGRLDRLLPVAYSRGGTTIYTMPLDPE